MTASIRHVSDLRLPQNLSDLLGRIVERQPLRLHQRNQAQQRQRRIVVGRSFKKSQFMTKQNPTRAVLFVNNELLSAYSVDLAAEQ